MITEILNGHDVHLIDTFIVVTQNSALYRVCRSLFSVHQSHYYIMRIWIVDDLLLIGCQSHGLATSCLFTITVIKILYVVVAWFCLIYFLLLIYPFLVDLCNWRLYRCISVANIINISTWMTITCINKYNHVNLWFWTCWQPD